MSSVVEVAVAGGLSALACGAAGLLVPRLIAAIPEPEPDPQPEPEPGAEPPRAPEAEKIPYADLAARPRLGLFAALVSAVVGGSIALRLGLTWELVFLLPLVPVGVALAVVDWRTHLLPKWVITPTYVGVVLLVLACAAITREPDRLLGALIGWAVIGGIYFLQWFIYPPGMGYGDVRLSGVLGIVLGYLGFDAAFYGGFAGLLLGALGGAALTLAKIVDRRNSPFGPWMLLGAWVGVLLAGPGG